ncbi:MAG: acyltransferase family protein [Candidatus Hermodarchaeota archaeon]
MMDNNAQIINQSSNDSQRRYDIDSLRVIAVILLIYFHTAMIFNIWSVFHLKDNELSLEAALFVAFLNIWHMPLFFFLAGISTFYALNFRSGRKYSIERVKRLLIPLIFGILIVIPPQIYFERLAWWSETRHSPINFNGTYLEFYPQFFIGIYPNGNFSWHHLWFLWYLFFISLITLPLLLRLKKEKGQRHIFAIASYIEQGRKIFLLAVPLILVNVCLRWIFPESHDFIFDWAAILFYLFIFVIGFLIVADSRFEDSIARNKALALVLGIVIAIFVLTVDTLIFFNAKSNALFNTRIFSNPTYLIIFYIIGMSLWSFCAWCWLIAFLGYGRKYLNKNNSFVKYASKIALPFYILHQTIIIIIGFYVIQWNTAILIKYLIITTAALFITVLFCELIKTNNITRFMFGMKTKSSE